LEARNERNPTKDVPVNGSGADMRDKGVRRKDSKTSPAVGNQKKSQVYSIISLWTSYVDGWGREGSHEAPLILRVFPQTPIDKLKEGQKSWTLTKDFALKGGRLHLTLGG